MLDQADTDIEKQPLTAHDRCDAGVKDSSCGAQAWVRATLKNGGTLLFCAHHYRKHNVGLVAQGATIEDFTNQIPTSGPGASA